jgi:hypothetical protein
MERALRWRFMGGSGAHVEDVGRHGRCGRGLIHFAGRHGGVGVAWRPRLRRRFGGGGDLGQIWALLAPIGA